GNTPDIFVKHIYATASIAGAVLFCILRAFAGRYISMLAATGFIIAVRLLASHFEWSLPKLS
ncbi:MAG: trimeric intracellular cation channel family protein, partial [Clostridiales bacterium]|nr:trimeric intracellular cation channel family protein [Clostridiales bacterium]